jgi:outer membrane lipoprotein-sorting protein
MKPYGINKSIKESKIVLVVFLCTISVVCFSQPDGYKKLASPEDFANKIEEVSKNTSTISADFTQLKEMQYLDAALESSGKFRFKSPNKVLWEYTEPFLYKVIINDGKLNLISEDKENQFDMNSNEIFQQINELLVIAVTGEIKSTKNYTIEFYENADFYLAALSPKSAEISQMINQMELYFDKKSLQVVKIRMIEASGDFSLISFKNQLINAPIDEDIFQP